MPNLLDLLKLMDDASGKYLHGTGTSEILKPKDRADISTCWSNIKSSENL